MCRWTSRLASGHEKIELSTIVHIQATDPVMSDLWLRRETFDRRGIVKARVVRRMRCEHISVSRAHAVVRALLVLQLNRSRRFS